VALAGWAYRKPVTLSRASGAVTNYQMKLKVGESAGSGANDVLATGCKTDFSDLRFTKADGDTLLDFYIEDMTGATPNQVATIWIEFDSIGTGDTTFYMYYGNAGAAAVSNGPNTFILFEDFNTLSDGDLNGQNGWSGHVTWDVATTTPYEGAKSAQAAAGGATVAVSKTISSGAEALYHLFMQMRMRHSAVSTGNGLDIYLKEGTGQITAIAISSSQFQALIAPPGWVNIGKAALDNTWYKVVLAIYSTSAHRTWVDDTQYSPANQNNMNNVSSTIDTIMLEQYSVGGTALVDQIMVGYYLPTGPAWGAWGAEENLTIIPVMPDEWFRPTEQPILEKNKIVGY